MSQTIRTKIIISAEDPAIIIWALTPAQYQFLEELFAALNQHSGLYGPTCELRQLDPEIIVKTPPVARYNGFYYDKEYYESIGQETIEQETQEGKK